MLWRNDPTNVESCAIQTSENGVAVVDAASSGDLAASASSWIIISCDETRRLKVIGSCVEPKLLVGTSVQTS